MKMQMRKTKAAAVFILAALLAVCLPGIPVRAADIQSYSITGTYRQTDARSMLTMINSFRTGTEAWQWNEANTQKVQITGLQGLQYDYNLERIAMQRAMELVVAYSHTRPNGEEFSTAYTGGYSVIGENIAIGTGNMTAANAFELWKETNQPYAGQDHRRNMLNSQYGAVGISHVYYNGCHYWVQEFADSVMSAAPTSPNDQTTTVEVAVSSDLNPRLIYTANPSSYEMNPGEIRSLPTVTAELRTNKTWGSAPSVSVPLTENYVWTVQDKNYAFITINLFSAKRTGQTSLVTTIGGQTITVPITINNDINNNRQDLSNATLQLAQDSYVYDGSAKTPAVTVSLNGYILNPNTDYTIAYSNNVSEGTALVTVTGIGNYIGSACTTFTITKPAVDLSRAQITLAQNSYVYDGSAKTPAVTVTLNGYTLGQNTDYTVVYYNNISEGTAWVTVTGIGNYAGSAYATFTITKPATDLSRAQITLAPSSYIYDGTAKTPAVTVTLNGYTLKQNTDYTVTYSNNVYVGTARATITGIGNYTGTAYATFTIITGQQTFDLSYAQITLAQNSYVYDGSAKTPAVTVSLNGYTLIANTDYSVRYFNNISEGTAWVTVTGIGSYSGSAYATFTITGQQSFDLSRAQITLAQNSYVYDGYAKTPAVTVTLNGYTLRQNIDYTVAYSNNVYMGTARATITGIGSYTGTAYATFTITGQQSFDLSRAQITLAQNSYVYDGYAKTPAVTVTLNGYTLRQNIDYTVAYSNNIYMGTARATITGIGNYTGSAYATFTITGQQSFDLSGAQITLAQSSYVYDGYAKTPAVTVTLNGYTLKQNTDYTVMYSNNIYAGTARVTVFGTNNYTGIANATFTITKPITDLSTALVALLENSYVYDGYAKTPAVTVMLNGSILKLDTDYTVSYSQNVDAGTAYVTIAGINNYTGSITKDFVITKAKNTVKLKKSNYYLNYSTKAQTVTLGVTKKAGTIKYSSNNSKVKVKAGKVTIAKKFTGTAVITIKVTDKNYKTVTKKVNIYVY